MWLRVIMILTSLFIVTPSFAHGADLHVLGAIMAIDGTHVEIKTTKGQSVNLQLNKQTRYRDESSPKGSNMPEVGDRVVVKATKDDKVLLATDIHFSAAKRVPAPIPPVPVQ